MTASMFIGRFQPLHKGHVALFKKVLDERKNIVIALRLTSKDSENPYDIMDRIEMIHREFPDAVVYPDSGRVVICLIPDIDEICYGRRVGWGIRQIYLDEKTESISATDLRKRK